MAGMADNNNDANKPVKECTARSMQRRRGRACSCSMRTSFSWMAAVSCRLASVSSASCCRSAEAAAPVEPPELRRSSRASLLASEEPRSRLRLCSCAGASMRSRPPPLAPSALSELLWRSRGTAGDASCNLGAVVAPAARHSHSDADDDHTSIVVPHAVVVSGLELSVSFL